MPESVRKRYELMKEKMPQDDKVEMMIENFDKALPHPDQADLTHLREKVTGLSI